MFTSLAEALPVTLNATQQLDKASIMRLTISHLKMRQLFGLGQYIIQLYLMMRQL